MFLTSLIHVVFRIVPHGQLGLIEYAQHEADTRSRRRCNGKAEHLPLC
jgi:hypothetical protein